MNPVMQDISTYILEAIERIIEAHTDSGERITPEAVKNEYGLATLERIIAEGKTLSDEERKEITDSRGAIVDQYYNSFRFSQEDETGFCYQDKIAPGLVADYIRERFSKYLEAENDKRLPVLIENLTDPTRRTTWLIGEITRQLGLPDMTKDIEKGRKIISALTPISAVEEREAEWLIPGYIPKNQITIIAGDGGVGKGFLWANIAAAISTGNPSVWEDQIPFEREANTPKKVIYFSSEDSTAVIIKKRLMAAGANMDNIKTVPIDNPLFSSVKFNSQELRAIIETERPALVIFDPLQSFLADNTMMNQRNAMRTNLNPLVEYGEQYGCTFIIVMHTNKLSGVWGRKRLADSADMWDIARSIFLVGKTGEGEDRYISHEKSNYAEQGDTVLFVIEDGKVQYKGSTDKKDRDFVLASPQAAATQYGQRSEAMDYIVSWLEAAENKTGTVKDIEAACKACGYSNGAIRYAKQELVKSKRVFIGRLDYQGAYIIKLLDKP